MRKEDINKLQELKEELNVAKERLINNKSLIMQMVIEQQIEYLEQQIKLLELKNTVLKS